MQPFNLEWEAPEFEHRPKEVGWYWTTIIVAVLILGAAVWQRNFLFAVFIVIAEILLLVWSNREPAMVQFRFTEKGLTIGGKTRYPLADFEHFSVEPDETALWPIMSFVLHRKFRLPLHVRTPRARLAEIHDHVAALVPEAPWDESLIDTLEKFFHF